LLHLTSRPHHITTEASYLCAWGIRKRVRNGVWAPRKSSDYRT